MLPIAVQTQGLTRRFDLHVALRDLSLSLPAASVLLVVGPNGAGKTTLLRLLATSLRPSAGRATVFGHDLVRDADAVRRITTYVGTAHGMYEGLTARENLAFAAAMSGRPDQADAVLERVGLSQVGDNPVRTFSHGMKRRLALARAWMLAPRLLLLDEPFSGLDAEGTLLVDALVAEVKSAGGCAVLATHEWERGLHLADVVIGLARGRQVEAAAAAEVSAPRLRALAGGRT
jgi:heme ABC exporter ATP-binding subunit CcmA